MDDDVLTSIIKISMMISKMVWAFSCDAFTVSGEITTVFCAPELSEVELLAFWQATNTRPAIRAKITFFINISF